MKNIFRSLLYSAMVLVAGFAASCTENEEGTGGYQGIPTIKVTPASLNVALAGGTTEQVVVETPADWTIDIDTDGVVASLSAGAGNAVVTFDVPAAQAMRTIKATVTAIGYVSGFPITKKAYISISQSDSEIPSVDGAFVYYENGGESVSKVDGYWPYVDAYAGWAPTGGEGFDQSGVTYTGKNASVRDSKKEWAPVGATYASDAPYAYMKDGSEFTINNITINNKVKNYIFSFTGHNQYANLIAAPYSPASVSPLKSGENLTVSVSVDGTNWGNIAFETMPDGNWEYAIAPFTLPAEADKLYIKFNNYKADTTTALPSADYQYQAALRFDDFRLVEGGEGPVVDFNNAAGGGNTGGGEASIEQILSSGSGNYILKNAWVLANYAQGFIATDATGKCILCFQGSGASVPAVGTVVEVNGDVVTYGGLLQFDKTATVTASNETKTVEYGNPTVMSGADLDSYVNAPEIMYVSYEGALSISGNYYNVIVEGATNVQGSISYPTEDMKSQLAPLSGKGIKVTGFLIGKPNSNSKYANTMITAVSATGNDPEPTPEPEPLEGTFNLISAINQVQAGKYYMAGYAEEYNNQGNITTFAPYPYHIWTGGINAGSSGTDLMTVNYSYTEGKLQLNPNLSAQDAAKGTAQLVELIAVDGKANTYYIKYGEKYLTCTGKRAVALIDTPAEWTFSAHAKGGICLTDVANNTILGTAGATYNMLRGYVSPASSLLYGVVFFAPSNGTVIPDPTPEPEPEPTPGETKTIAEILAAGQGATLSGSIEGIVISNMDLNNLTSKRGMYVQDATGALQFFLAANHEYTFGTKVRIDLTGTTLGDYNGAVQISGLALEKITVVSTGNTVEPKVVTIADFLANKYEGQYVAIEGVQVAAADLTKTWVTGGAHTSINVEDANGNKFVVFSSKYATYGAEAVAQGSGTIKGISSINNGSMQIIFTQTSDYAGLTGARFDGTTPEPTPDPTPTPGEGDFGSDSIFVQATDDTTIAAYSLGTSTINGSSCSGFKLGTSKLAGVFTSKAVAVTGDKTLELYAFAWKGKSAKLYIKVVGGGEASVSEITLAANDGATGNPPYTITAAESDKYTVTLTGLTATSTVVFSTSAEFTNASDSSNGRAVIAGVHLK